MDEIGKISISQHACGEELVPQLGRQVGGWVWQKKGRKEVARARLEGRLGGKKWEQRDCSTLQP